MRLVRTVAELRRALGVERLASRRIGFVPTMGALHEGHLSLARRARAECDVVVCSVFVNPTQFNDARDLEAYPRTEAADAALLDAAGVDIIFAPGVDEMYPEGSTTSVDVGDIAEPLEGVARGTAHFRGVATVVAKLLNIVQPQVAYFGQKDAQQVLVVRRLVRDLDMPVEIVACPVVREADGLAMSSRNARLSREARADALGLSAALHRMEAMVAVGERACEPLVAAGLETLARHRIPASAVDYLAIVDAATLQPLSRVTDGALVAVAAHVGGVRLIDNLVVGIA